MRILIATAHRNMVGGVEKYLQKILPILAHRGHEMALVYEHRFDPEQERIDRLDLDLPSHGIEESGVGQGIGFVRNWKPDVVYSQGLESVDFQAALLEEYPVVFYAHNYLGTCISGEKCHSFPSPVPCDRQFGPACLALYLPRRCGGLHPLTMLKMYRRSAEHNLQLPQYAAILVASAHMRREYERHGVPSERVHLTPLPNPIEVDRSESGEKTGTRGQLLFLGRLTKIKGGAELLRAMPLAEKQLGFPLALTIAGDGPERGRLEKFAAQHRLAVEFAGWVGGARKSELIEKADLLVVPSLWPEPFGLVGIESGAHGLPAVGYDAGGISDWLISGYSGELASAQPPTVEGLADSICRALSNPAHYAHLCRGAREVAGRFTFATHLSQLENTLESVLEDMRRTTAVSAPA